MIVGFDGAICRQIILFVLDNGRVGHNTLLKRFGDEAPRSLSPLMACGVLVSDGDAVIPNPACLQEITNWAKLERLLFVHQSEDERIIEG